MDPIQSPEIAGQQIAAELVLASEITGAGPLDGVLLRKMAEDARHYLSKFPWCSQVLEIRFAGGVGGIFAVFFVHILPNSPEADPWVWAIVGDIPQACFPLSKCNSARSAFKTYVTGLFKWVELASKGESGTEEQGVLPVNLPTTTEWAYRMQQKLTVLTEKIKPLFDSKPNPAA